MMRPVPPGEVLREQLEELRMSATQLAAHLDVPTNRVTEILNAERALTADTALRLSKFFGTTAEFWLALQSNYELRKAELRSDPAAKVMPLSDAYTSARYSVRSSGSLPPHVRTGAAKATEGKPKKVAKAKQFAKKSAKTAGRGAKKADATSTKTR